MIDTNAISRELLLDALAREAIKPAFQCLVDFRDYGVKGFEVLARWIEPGIGEIPPVRFIPAMEQHGLMDALLIHMLSKACQIAVTWEGDFALAFNLSPLQLQNPALFGLIREAAGSVQFPLARLQMEITENALVTDMGVATSLIRQLKSAGVQIVLDDFGTGFSNLERLHAFAFDKLKIDAGFVRKMDSDGDSRRIVSSIVGLGQSLGVDVVAEGVETQMQADILRDLGCSFGQGWLFGRAVPPPDAALLLRRRFGQPASGDRLSTVSPFQRLHQLEALYRNAPVALCFIDRAQRCVSANHRFQQVVGLTSSRLMGRRLSDVVSVASMGGLLAAVERISQGAAPAQVQIEAPCDAWYLASVQPVTDEVGEWIGTSIIMLNVTDQRRAERAIRESEEHFRRANELCPDIAWTALPDGTLNYMGPTFGETRNMSVEDRIAAWLEGMHPEDRLRVRKEWLAWLPSGQPFETNFRTKWSDGSWHWVNSRAQPHYGPDGKIDRWYGLMVDITGRRALERRIFVLERLLARSRRRQA